MSLATGVVTIRRDARLLFVDLAFALGFYASLLVVVLTIGNDVFNAAFPNPWRLWVCIPAFLAVAHFWTVVLRRV